MAANESQKRNNEWSAVNEDNVLRGKTVSFKCDYDHLGKLLLDKLERSPDFVGQLDAQSGKEDTFASMRDRAVKCALWLKKQGIKPGDVIAICTNNHLDAFVPCFGAIFVGVIFCPWDLQMNTDLARYFLVTSKPKIIFTNESTAAIVLEAAKAENHDLKTVVFGEHSGTISFSEVLEGHAESEVKNFRCTDVKDIHDTVTILFSSGTTGLPKGAQISHFSLLHHVALQAGMNMKDQRPLWFSTIYWITSVLLIIQAIVEPLTRILYPVFDEEMTCKLIEKYKLTWLFLVTSSVNRLLKSGYIGKYDLSSLQYISTGGTRFTAEARDKLKSLLPRVMVWQGYGLSEVGGLCSIQTALDESLSCGTPCVNVQIKVVDVETGKALGPNKTGEAWVKSPTVTTGYYNNPEATKKLIDSQGWLHTGDLVYYNENGEIFIVDRLKELIKYIDYHILPSEIEKLLQSHPNVMEVAVVAAPHHIDVERPLAFVVKVPGTKNESSVAIEDNVLKGRTVIFNCAYDHLGKFLLDKLERSPDFVGQVDSQSGKRDTFASMRDRAVKCALWLKKQGIKPGDVIAVCTNNHLDTFVPCLGAIFVGAIFCPWDLQMNTDLARHFLVTTRPKVIFTNESAVSTALKAAKAENHDLTAVVFGQHPGTISFSEVLEGHSEFEVKNFRCTEIKDVHDTATILFSSGTTALPKGMQLSHYSLLYRVTLQHDQDMEDQRSLWFSTIFWIGGVVMMIKDIAGTITRILYPVFDEEMTCKLIEKYKVAWLFLGTRMVNRLLKSGYISKYDLSSLRRITTGGMRYTDEAHNELKSLLPHVMVCHGYGMSETGGLCSIQTAQNAPVSCGTPCANVQMKVVDVETGKALGPNKTGEAWVKSPMVTTGYYNNPEATKELIDSQGWLHTGDLVYYNENGEIFVVDRLKEMIKYNDYHVSPSEIEKVLQTHPDVMEVAVVGLPHYADDQRPLAFVVKVPGTKVTEKELINMVDKKMMDCYRLRGGVIFLECLPCTPSGKISRKVLKEMAKALEVLD